MSGETVEVKTEDERNRIKDVCSTNKKEKKQENVLPKKWGGGIKQQIKPRVLIMGGQKKLKKRRICRKASFSGCESIAKDSK